MNPAPCNELDGETRRREAPLWSIYGVDRCLNDNIDGVNSVQNQIQITRIKTQLFESVSCGIQKTKTFSLLGNIKFLFQSVVRLWSVK